MDGVVSPPNPRGLAWQIPHLSAAQPGAESGNTRAAASHPRVGYVGELDGVGGWPGQLARTPRTAVRRKMPHPRCFTECRWPGARPSIACRREASQIQLPVLPMADGSIPHMGPAKGCHRIWRGGGFSNLTLRRTRSRGTVLTSPRSIGGLVVVWVEVDVAVARGCPGDSVGRWIGGGGGGV